MITPLFQQHQALNAKIVPYAGWDMPGYYTSPVSEALAVRTGCGVFDVSHMGEFRVTGTGSAAFLQFVATNDISTLKPGAALYSLLLNERGGVVDDVIVYCFANDDFLIVVNAGCASKDWQWLNQMAQDFPSVSIADESNETALIAVQGRTAVDSVDALCSQNVCQTPRFCFQSARMTGVEIMLSRTGYTGNDGFEIFCSPKDSSLIWNTLIDTGATPCGLVSRDILRTEAAYPLYGHELLDDISPKESGTAWAVKPRAKNFVGRDAFGHVDKHCQKLVGLKVLEKAIPRQDCDILCNEDIGDKIGIVTSGTLSPMLNVGIALARINFEHSVPGTLVNMDIRGRRVPVEVASLPFYRNGV